MSLRAWAFALPLGFLIWAVLIAGGIRLREAALRGELPVLHLGDAR